MDLQPTLQGKLLQLRPLAPGDFEDLLSAASDPLIWEQHPENTRYRRDVFERFFATAMASRGAFAILDCATSQVAGSSRYYEYDPQAKSVFIGYTFLRRTHWGGSYNAELKHLMLTHAFQYVDRVLFHVGETNFRSQKALSKIGAQPFGKVQFPEDQGRISLVFKIDRKDFLRPR